MDIVERFLKYIAIDTVSDEDSETIPSTKSQLELAKILVEDLKEIGLDNAYVDEYGYVYGRIDLGKKRTIGLIAHMDTAPDFVGGCKKTKIVNNYQGEEVVLDSGDTLTRDKFPCLKEVIGDDLIFTDGYHLLGADDKAGIAIIFEVVKEVLANKDNYNNNIAICFTVDEEIGRGPHKFDLKKMNADVAYTIDGGSIYYINNENFNATRANVKFYGQSVHPGSAKNIMVNAIRKATEFNGYLPKDMVPEKTEDHEGFIHLIDMKGDVNYAESSYILRDHDERLLEKQKQMFLDIKDKMLKEEPKLKIEVEIHDEYKNMWTYFLHHPEALHLINRVYVNMKLKLGYEAIRGGTDGATITYMGLPCPNLGTGGFNCHGKYEFLSITQMKKMAEILKNLAELD